MRQEKRDDELANLIQEVKMEATIESKGVVDYLQIYEYNQINEYYIYIFWWYLSIEYVFWVHEYMYIYFTNDLFVEDEARTFERGEVEPSTVHPHCFVWEKMGS